MSFIRVYLPVIISGLILFGTSSFAADGMRSPFRKNKPKQIIYDSGSPGASLGKGLIRGFSKWISPVDGPRSPSYPTGSAYGYDAINKYGFFIGIILTADRLLHESDFPMEPRMILYGTERFYDPVEMNTYWWDGSAKP